MSQMQRASDDALLNETLEAIGGFVIDPFDAVIVTYTDSTKENIDTVVYKTGGISGTTVATVTVTYPSSTVENYVKT